MKPSIAEAKSLRAALSELTESRGMGKDCPSAETLWDSATERLGPEADAPILLHIGECGACGLAWELARDLAPTREQETATERSRWLPLAAAALLAVAVTGVVVDQQRRQDPASSSYRESAVEWLVSTTPQDRPLSREDCRLRWASGPDGTTYDVVVTTEELEPITHAWALEEAELSIDRPALNGVASDESIFWRVTAHSPDGAVTESVTFITRIE